MSGINEFSIESFSWSDNSQRLRLFLTQEQIEKLVEDLKTGLSEKQSDIDEAVISLNVRKLNYDRN